MNLNNHGQSLLSVLTAATLGGMVTLTMASSVQNLFRSAKHSELNGELAQLRTTLVEQIDCEATFKDAGINPNDPAKCNSDSSTLGQDKSPTFLRLRRKTRDGSVRYLTGPLVNGAGTLGSYSLRTTCSKKEQTLVIRVARPQGNGFAKDPLTRQTASWDANKALLVGEVPNLPLCYGKQDSGSAPKHATLYLTLPFYNRDGINVEVDMTGSAPKVRGQATLQSWDWTAPFSSQGKILVSTSYRYVDVRVGYYNVTATPHLRVSSPGNGRVVFSLGAMSDLESPSKGNPIKGSVGVELTLVQL